MENLPSDLKVTTQRCTKVVPNEKTKRRFMFLSNIDRTLSFNVETIHFFQAQPNFPPEMVADKLEVGLGRLLVPYDFLAGRLKLDPNDEEGRLAVDCNSDGVGFIVASSDLTLDQIGDLVYPNPAFRQLIFESFAALEPEDQPLFLLQVTTFKCGGFAMGISNNHALMDGLSFKILLENLASFAADKPIVVVPHNNRRLLAARSPPTVTFSHPELLELPPQPPGQEDSISKLFESTLENLDIKVLHLTANDIANLREKAKIIGGANDVSFKITSFNVVMAHLWRCKALSGEKRNDWDKTSTILYALDLRSRLRPPLPPSYTGNAILNAYGTTTIRELQQANFSDLVRIISEGPTRVTDEYARSVIDWGELHKGFPCGDVLVSSWWRLGFDQVDYPWGRPKYCCPLVHHRKDIILLFPDNEDVTAKGVNVLVALPTEEMNMFQDLFHKFLA